MELRCPDCLSPEVGAIDMVAALRGWPTGSALRGERFVDCASELDRLIGCSGPA
jgi:hypothetical protein